MRNMKKLLTIIVAFCMLLTGCSDDKDIAATSSKTTLEANTSSDSKKTDKSQTDSVSDAESKIATLYTNADGTSNFDVVEFEYTGEFSIDVLANGLSQVTGLDFFLSYSVEPEGIYIDWENSSTLIANLDEREQKEQYYFFDADSLRWFMMDSLWKTLTENFGDVDVYYTMNGGNSLVFNDLSPVNKFPSDIPYMGYEFYTANSNDRGSEAISSEDAFTIVRNVLDARGQVAPVIVQTDDEDINGEHAYTFSAGENSVDGVKYTAMYYYAVTDSGKVYYLDFLEGADWIFFDTQANG